MSDDILKDTGRWLEMFDDESKTPSVSTALIRGAHTEIIALRAENARLTAAVQTTRRETFEECARIAKGCCLVPPDGGAPSAEETAMCDQIADILRRHAPIAATTPQQPAWIQKVREALVPFAKAAEMFSWPMLEDGTFPIAPGTRLTVGDLRKAREALALLPPEHQQ